MKDYNSNEDFKKALNRDIDWFKSALHYSFRNLDIYLKCKIEVGEVVLLKSTLEKGIVRSFRLDVKPLQGALEMSERLIYVVVCTIAGDKKVEMNDIVIYSDAARLLYAKQVVVKEETPKKTDDEIPF